MWLQLAILAAAYLLQYATTAKLQKPKPAAFDSFDFPRCDEGTEQSVIFGQVWTKDWMVLSVRNMRTKAIKTKRSKK